jgi:Cof subfamily protein (haloacid dehalogenase superfamily)
MLNAVRLILIDIDDTLVGESGKIHPSVFQAIGKARTKGIRLAISTGRPGFGETLDYYAKIVSEDSYHSFFNGGLVKNVYGHSLYSAKLSFYYVKILLELAKNNAWDFEYYTEDNLYTQKVSEIGKKHQKIINFNAIEVENLLEIQEKPVKIQYVVTEENVEEVIKNLKFLDVSYGVGKNAKAPNINFISVLPNGNSKASGARILAGFYGVNFSEIMMIGDSQGDLDLIKEVGFGVAVQNATPEVIKAANFVVESANEGGVASAIKLAIETNI